MLCFREIFFQGGVWGLNRRSGPGGIGTHEHGLGVRHGDWLVQQGEHFLLGFFEPSEVVEAPLRHFAEHGEVVAVELVGIRGRRGGDFVEDPFVGVAGAVEMAKALEAEPDLVNGGAAVARVVLDFGELEEHRVGAKDIAGFIEVVRDFVACFALPIGPDSGLFLAVFLSGFEELKGLAHRFVGAPEATEGLDVDVLRLGGERAGGVGGKESLGAGEGFREVLVQIGDEREAEGDFAGLGLRHVDELDTVVELRCGFVIALREVRVGDFHFCAER